MEWTTFMAAVAALAGSVVAAVERAWALALASAALGLLALAAAFDKLVV